MIEHEKAAEYVEEAKRTLDAAGFGITEANLARLHSAFVTGWTECEVFYQGGEFRRNFELAMHNAIEHERRRCAVIASDEKHKANGGEGQRTGSRIQTRIIKGENP